ncbi:MAG: hypothetical protein HYU76_13900 [Betaproteobacteria bacterium]|nr:hypothetical protein [Betaproteobacteria bacterium]
MIFSTAFYAPRVKALLSWSHAQPADEPLSRALVITAVIGVGLIFDQHLEFWGQTLTNVGIWAVFVCWLRRAGSHDQLALTVCVLYATLGEIFLSLVWGLYEYRLANVPLFVPPGHALLFVLGRILAERAREWIVWFVPLAAAPFVCLFAWTKVGTLDALLFVLFLMCLLSGRASRLYAVMFVLSLAMEIYGTWLGNWTWAEEAPWLGFTTVNPPLAAGAFYCMLDMLVVATVAKVRAGARPLGLRPALRARPRLAARDWLRIRAAAVPASRN